MARIITPEEAQRLIGEGTRYLDVRTVAEYEAGHPVSALNIPFVVQDPVSQQMALNTNFLDLVAAHFPPEETFIIACQAGGRSARASDMLEQMSYPDLLDMGDGYGGWEACELPVATGPDPERGFEALKSRAG